MRRWTSVITVCVCLFSLRAATWAQQGKPKVDLISVVGCASRNVDKSWTLTNASEPMVIKTATTSREDIDNARVQPLGKNRFRLIGTAEFGPPEDLLSDPTRSQFTVKGSENTTGQLQNGHKLVVKGLLIIAPNEKRINLTSVQKLSEKCH